MHIGEWPSALRIRSRRPYLAGQSLSGGQSIGGTSQSISTDAPYWKMDLNGVVIRDGETLRAWRQIEGALDGRANTIDIAMCDVARPWGVSPDFLPHSDGTPFDDGTLYAHDPMATLSASAALRATTLVIAKAVPFWINGGETLSLEHDEPWGHRWYRIKQVTAQDDESATVKITPPLRAAIASGARVELALPRCRMRLAEGEGMAAEVDLGRNASPSVSFVEDI